MWSRSRHGDETCSRRRCLQTKSCTERHSSSGWIGEAELFSWYAMFDRYCNATIEYASLLSVGINGRLVDWPCFWHGRRQWTNQWGWKRGKVGVSWLVTVESLLAIAIISVVVMDPAGEQLWFYGVQMIISVVVTFFELLVLLLIFFRIVLWTIGLYPLLKTSRWHEFEI